MAWIVDNFALPEPVIPSVVIPAQEGMTKLGKLQSKIT